MATSRLSLLCVAARTLKEEADGHRKAKSFDKAFRCLTSAIQVEEMAKADILYLERCKVLMELRLYRCAMVDAMQALEISPNWCRAHQYVGLVNFFLGNLDAARTSLEEALKKLSEEPPVPGRETVKELLKEELEKHIAAVSKPQSATKNGFQTGELVAVVPHGLKVHWYATVKGTKLEESKTGPKPMVEVQFVEDGETELVPESHVARVRLVKSPTEEFNVGELVWLVNKRSNITSGVVEQIDDEKSKYHIKFPGVGKLMIVAFEEAKTEAEARATPLTSKQKTSPEKTPKTKKRKGPPGGSELAEIAAQERHKRQELDRVLAERQSQLDKDLQPLRDLEQQQQSILESPPQSNTPPHGLVEATPPEPPKAKRPASPHHHQTTDT